MILEDTFETVKYLTGEVEVEFTSLDDYWGFTVEGRLRSLAVHLNMLPRLPWETLMFGEDQGNLGFFQIQHNN